MTSSGSGGTSLSLETAGGWNGRSVRPDPPSHARAPRSPLRPAWHPPYKVLPLVGRLMVRETLSR